MLPAAIAQEYLRQREALLQAFPELAEDEATLRDTLEGISHAPDLIATFIRDARSDEAMAEALKAMIGDMVIRKERFVYRAERRRLAAQRLMDACELRKIEMPDFTASVRSVPSKVVIDDEAALPDTLCRTIRQPDKAAIREALAMGAVTGAHLTNGSETLTIRVK
jgi:hypothetical protein